MSENNVVSLRQKDEIDDPLTEILRAGARRLIEQAVEGRALGFPGLARRFEATGRSPARRSART
jgi:hypothetical protein